MFWNHCSLESPLPFICPENKKYFLSIVPISSLKLTAGSKAVEQNVELRQNPQLAV